MQVDVLYKIKSDPKFHQHLRANSQWYKYLNRTPEALTHFMEEAKTVYKMRPTDKLNDLSNRIEMVKTFMNIMK